MTYLTKLRYTIGDRQKDRCSYDLLATRKKEPAELHVEVKGTSGVQGPFFMTRNEYAYRRDPRWQLAMVPNALGEPIVQLLTLSETER